MSGRDAFVDARASLAPTALPMVSAQGLQGGVLLALLAVAGCLALGAPALALSAAAAASAVMALLVATRLARLTGDVALLAALSWFVCAVAMSGDPLLTLPAHAVAVALGAVVPGRRLALVLPAAAMALVAAVLAATSTGGAVAHALCFLGFGAMGRGLFFSSLFFVRRREQGRVDAEILRMLDDARLLRVVGGDASAPATPEAERQRALARVLAARDACYRLLSLGAPALVADGAALYLVDERTQRLVLKEQRADGESAAEHTLSAKDGVPGLALQKRAAVRLVDADGGVIRAHRALARSALAVPLMDGNTPFGVLVMDRSRAVAFTEAEERFLWALAREMESALATERVLASLDDERRRVARVLEAARAFSGVVRLEDALDQILSVTAELSPRAGVAVLSVERDATGTPLLCVARAQGPCGLKEEERLPVDPASWLGRAFEQREALPHTSLADAPARGLARKDDDGATRLGDLCVLPLIGQGEVGGLLVVAMPAGARLSNEVRSALRALADLAGVALAGARLFFVVEQRATTDGLTGLFNRRTLDEKLSEAIARAKRTQGPLAVLLTDVDHFKRVNDTYGHASGDDVLRGVSKALKATARTCDVVARYGGEEFVLVLEGTDAAGAVRAAERARLGVKGLVFETAKGPLQVTSSFGVALFSAGDDPHALLERADANLYKAKQQGRDRVVL